MDYHFENKILLSEESEYKNLYSWSLQEFNKEDKKIGGNQIPWQWSLYFTASELCHHYSIDINKSNIHENERSMQESEMITAVLHPGICSDGKLLEDGVLYSMFGTNRPISQFNLRIRKVDGSENETCHIWGCVSHTLELDFRDVTTDDTIDISLGLSPQRFNKIAELIKIQYVDILQLYLDEVSGFYSEWSPSIITGSIKVLAAQKEQVVVKEEECKIDPPRLGDVGEFNLRVTQRHKLNLKQDLRSINIDKLFEEPDDYKEYLVDEQKCKEYSEDKDSLILSQLARNEAALKKLHTPVWFIFIILCFLFIKFMF